MHLIPRGGKEERKHQHLLSGSSSVWKLSLTLPKLGREDDIMKTFSVLLVTHLLIEGKGYANQFFPFFFFFFFFFPLLECWHRTLMRFGRRCFKLETWEELTVDEGYWGHPKTSGKTASHYRKGNFAKFGIGQKTELHRRRNSWRSELNSWKVARLHMWTTPN